MGGYNDFDRVDCVCVLFVDAVEVVCVVVASVVVDGCDVCSDSFDSSDVCDSCLMGGDDVDDVAISKSCSTCFLIDVGKDSTPWHVSFALSLLDSCEL